jgi:hypothetical protein
LLLAILSLGTLQYLFSFSSTRATFHTVPAIVFPPSSFHPAPYPDPPHEVEAEGKKGQDWWHWDTPTKFGAVKSTDGGDVGCDTFPTELLGKIQVVLQVGGHGDNGNWTDAQLKSVVRCIDNVLVLGDGNSTYGDSKHQTVDVLAGLPAETYLQKEDYAIYTREASKRGSDAAKLDKYKFLPSVEHAVAERPEAEWFVFIQPTTYMFWDNAFRLLENYDHRIPYFFGSPSPGLNLPKSNPTDEEIWYAPSGPSYILSHEAAHRLADRQKNGVGVTGPRLSHEYKSSLLSSPEVIGDAILAFALHDKADVDLSGLWPMFTAHDLAGIPFRHNKAYWCEPVLSLSATPPSEMQKLWQWEMKRDRSKRPLLYADLIEITDLGRIWTREDWDATEGVDAYTPPESTGAHTNLQGCEEACQEDDGCLQWTWHGGKCSMGRSTRLGHYKEPEGKFQGNESRFISGWDIDKIRRGKRRYKCEDGPHWVKPSVQRRE